MIDHQSQEDLVALSILYEIKQADPALLLTFPSRRNQNTEMSRYVDDLGLQARLEAFVRTVIQFSPSQAVTEDELIAVAQWCGVFTDRKINNFALDLALRKVALPTEVNAVGDPEQKWILPLSQPEETLLNVDSSHTG